MHRGAAALILGALGCLAGCTSGWINDPSPTTANLINDLKLEGFKCHAGFSNIECKQSEAFVEKSSKICTAEGGCVAQPCHDVRVVYLITQARDGIPGIVQTTERTVTRNIPKGDLYTAERVAELKDYCAIR